MGDDTKLDVTLSVVLEDVCEKVHPSKMEQLGYVEQGCSDHYRHDVKEENPPVSSLHHPGLVCEREADGIIALHGDSHGQEYARRDCNVTNAITYWDEFGSKLVTWFEGVDREHKVGQDHQHVCKAECSQEVVKHIPH